MRKYSKYLASSLFILLTTLVLSSTVFAAEKTARGKIKTSSSANANGASVSVECNGTTLNDTTDSNGDFEVVFADGVCESGALATLNASFNGESATATKEAGIGPIINFNVVFLAETTAVPEFGAVTGVLAAAGSAFAYFKLRRKVA